MEDYLVCPICGEKVKNLLIHIKRNHIPDIKSRADFEAYFPNLKGCKLQISQRHKKNCKCPYCDMEYNGFGYLQLHIKNKHPENFEKQCHFKYDPIECPVCGKMVGNLKQHIHETHYMNWDEFCNTYNWDTKLVKNITPEYRKLLSENKRKFYQSEQGIKLKEIQSKKWTENNPMTDPKILEKSMFTRSHNGNCHPRLNDMRGIKIIYYDYTFRSLNEFEFYLLCIKYGFNIIYEPNNYCIKWFNSIKKYYTTYLPDFYIDNIGIIELKDSKSRIKKACMEEKYIKVEQIYNNLQIPFKITNIKDFFNTHNIKLTYKDTDYIKLMIDEAIKDNKIHIISPYRHSKKLLKLFSTDDLSKIDIIKFTKKTGHNLYGEL